MHLNLHPAFRAAVLGALLCLSACAPVNNLLASVGIGPNAVPIPIQTLTVPYGTSVKEFCVQARQGLAYQDLDVSGPITLAARDVGLSQPRPEAPAFVARVLPAEGESFPVGDTFIVRVRPKTSFAPFLAVAEPFSLQGKLYFRPSVARRSAEGVEQVLEVSSPLEVWVSTLQGEGCFDLEFVRHR